MITRHRAAFLAAAAILVAAVGCEKVPLLAPSGSSITLTASANTLPTNGTTTILAQVIEASGQVPHSGTAITFTTTLGTVQPNPASTDVNGIASVTFNAGNNSGTATISATSGGASVASGGQVKIAIGAAAVGRVNVSASPSAVPAFGGTSTITASVLDINGNPLRVVPVTFTTTAGALSMAVINTDQNGTAQSVLTTTQQATVTASVGAQGATGGGTGTTPGTGTGGSGSGGGTGSTSPTAGQASGTVTVTVLNAATLVINQPSTPPSAGLPSTFSFVVTAPSSNASPVRDVTVAWGDGSTQDLGAISGTVPVTHVYQTAGNYVINATLLDASGNTFNINSPVSVVPTALPTLIITATSVPSVHAPSMPVTFQLQVTTPTGISIQNATIDWGDAGPGGTPGRGDVSTLGAVNGTVTLTHAYTSAGVFTVVLTVTDSLGRTPFGTTTVTLP